MLDKKTRSLRSPPSSQFFSPAQTMLAEWEGPADFNSMSNNVSNNAMIRQVAKGISSQSNYLEAALGERDSGMEEAPEDHLSKQ